MQRLTRLQSSFIDHMDDIAKLVLASEVRSTANSYDSTVETTSSQCHFLKLDVPPFGSLDPHNLIFKVSQLFDYHATLAEEHIIVVHLLTLTNQH